MALSYNQGVNEGHQRLKLPAVSAAGSFLAIWLVALFTNPLDKIGLAILIFASLLVFLISLGYLVIRLQLGEVSRKNRSRIIIISIFLVVLLMFRSAQSLGWVDALVLLCITSGLLFYSSKRTL